MAKRANNKTAANGRVYRKEEQLDLFAQHNLDTVERPSAADSRLKPEMCGDRWIEYGSPWPLDANSNGPV